VMTDRDVSATRRSLTEEKEKKRKEKEKGE
jgi:hypothetical protein